MHVHVHIYNDLSSEYGTHVVVNFLSQVNFVFLLFLHTMVMKLKVETKEKLKLRANKKLTTTHMYKLSS